MNPVGMQRPLAVMMRSAAQTMSPDATACDAARQMRVAKVGALLVREGTCYLGIISEADLVRKVLAESLVPARHSCAVGHECAADHDRCDCVGP